MGELGGRAGKTRNRILDPEVYRAVQSNVHSNVDCKEQYRINTVEGNMVYTEIWWLHLAFSEHLL